MNRINARLVLLRLLPIALVAASALSWRPLVGQDSSAASLTEALSREDAGKLASDAIRRGDAVQGAILFAQQSLGCAGCHARGADDLLGPDLTRSMQNPERDQGQGVGNAYVVDAILRPSKDIAKGFEATKVLTVDGRLISGRIIGDHPDHLVLREVAGNKNRVKIPKSDIERLEKEETSAMPANLADRLASRQQFLDLVRYVIEIAGTGDAATGQPTNGSPEEVAPGDRAAGSARRLDPVVRGHSLINRLGCVNCHATPADHAITSNPLSSKRGPILTRVVARSDPAYLREFIARPHAVKPGTGMPDVMHHLPASQRDRAADAMVYYLMSLSERPFRRGAIDAEAASRGQTLFHEVGCVACHSPRGEDGTESLPSHSVALGDLSKKYNASGLVAFLEDPLSIRPSGRMPDMKLSHWEAVDLAHYLLSDPPNARAAATGGEPSEPAASPDELVATGRQFFSQLGCAKCHEAEASPTSHSPELAKLALPVRSFPSLTDLNPERGCLSSSAGDHPRFDLDDEERDAIRQALKKHADPLGDREQIVMSMETLRCYACHSRDGLGGISDERDLYFHTTNENLGPQGRIPPALTGVGGKLKRKWMRQVLVSGRAIRPYVKTRMPQYGAENVSHLVDLFAAVDEKPAGMLPRMDDPKEAKKVGTELVGNQGLNCIACHTFQLQPAQTMPAVDLTEMAERLHPEWFHRYMLSPQQFSPGTVMPSFWPGGKAIRKEIAGGDPERQIGSIWEYLLDGRQARTPRGLRREPIELLAREGHAVMLRRSYPGIGKRGIGVGYPGGVNLAFDAEQMRLAMIWKGKFADPGGVWWSQGHGSVRPLGSDLVRFAKGPDLDDADAPWVVDNGRPPRHQFTGYSLDPVGRPAFTYRFDDLEIEDYAYDVPAAESRATVLRRRVTLTSDRGHQGLMFRVADGKRIEKIDNRLFQVDGALRIQLPPACAAEIKTTEQGQQLMIPIEVPAGTTVIEMDYAW